MGGGRLTEKGHVRDGVIRFRAERKRKKQDKKPEQKGSYTEFFHSATDGASVLLPNAANAFARQQDNRKDCGVDQREEYDCKQILHRRAPACGKPQEKEKREHTE